MTKPGMNRTIKYGVGGGEKLRYSRCRWEVDGWPNLDDSAGLDQEWCGRGNVAIRLDGATGLSDCLIRYKWNVDIN